MRICSIISTLTSGGAEMLVSNLSTSFVAQGHQAAVMTLCAAETVGNPLEIEARMRASLLEGGVEVQSLQLADPGNLLAGAMAIRAALKQIRPDIVHTHNARALLMMMLAGVRLPIVLTHHNTRLSFPAWFYRLFDFAVDSYVAISPEVERLTRQHARGDISVILNGVGKNFAVGTPRDRMAGRPKMLSVGALTDQKNYPCLVRMVPELKAMLGTGLSVQVAGDGALRPSLEEQAKAIGAAPELAFLGARGDVPEMLAAADLFVNCSHYEGLSVATLEAMTTGLPVVATDVPGNRELVKHEGNGLIVPADNAAAIAAAIKRLADDPELYARLSLGAIATAKLYSMDNCVSGHLKLYEQVLEKRRGRGRAGGTSTRRLAPNGNAQ